MFADRTTPRGTLRVPSDLVHAFCGIPSANEEYRSGNRLFKNAIESGVSFQLLSPLCLMAF